MSQVELYEYEEILKEFGDDKIGFLEFLDTKRVVVVEVGKMGDEIDKKLMNKGYKIGWRVLVIVG